MGMQEKALRKYIQEQEKQDQIEDKVSTKEHENPFKGNARKSKGINPQCPEHRTASVLEALAVRYPFRGFKATPFRGGLDSSRRAALSALRLFHHIFKKGGDEDVRSQVPYSVREGAL